MCVGVWLSQSVSGAFLSGHLTVISGFIDSALCTLQPVYVGWPVAEWLFHHQPTSVLSLYVMHFCAWLYVYEGAAAMQYTECTLIIVLVIMRCPWAVRVSHTWSRMDTERFVFQIGHDTTAQ